MAANNPFDVEAAQGDVAEVVLRSSEIVVLAQIIKALIAFISIAFLARLLSAEDFGIMAICGAVTGILARLKDGGLSTAVIQAEHISEQQASNIFWVNVVIGLCLMCLCVLISPFLASAYAEPRLGTALIAISISFIFGGLGVQFDALLRRRLDYTNIMLIEIFTVTIATIVACYMAWVGYGYWALITLAVSPIAGHFVLASYVSKWRPLLYKRTTSISSLLKFGGTALLGSVLATVTVSSVAMVVGLIDGISAAGIYSRAILIVGIFSAMFLIPISHVTQSGLSRFQGESLKDSFDNLALSSLRLVSIIAMFLAVVLFLFPSVLALLILGEGWTNAGDLIKLLAPLAVVEPIIYLLACQLTAKGKPEIVLKLRAIDLGVVWVLIAISFSFGFLAMLTVYAAGSIVIRFPLFVLMSCHSLNIAREKLLPYFLYPLFCGVSTAILIMFVDNIVLISSGLIWQMFSFLLICVLYSSLLLLHPQIRRTVLTYISVKYKKISITTR